MNPLNIFRRKSVSINTILSRLEAAHASTSGVSVTPENCEQSPTVKAIVTAITRRFAVMPVHVYRKQTTRSGGASKEPLTSHPVEKLLAWPNDWQAGVNYWMDAASWLARYGNFYAYKARGSTGPIRRLLPLLPGSVSVEQASDFSLLYKVHTQSEGIKELSQGDVHHARTTARNGYKGDSPVADVAEAIAMEIAAERYGGALFGNGAMPGLIFKYAEGSAGHKTQEERNQFVEDVQNAYSKKGRFKAMLLPKGIDLGDPLNIENDKAQFLELRQYQRTVIAGAWGCPPHLVGDLSKGTFNNVEMQGIEFSTNVILPLARVFEAAMERDLLTDADTNSGVIIRFNTDAMLRGDFKTRQEGLAVQRQNGIISANEWREREGMNPRKDQGGDDYFEQGPSGQTPAGKPKPAPDEEEDGNDDAASSR